ncbi:squalene/phytoene synthase family protein [Jannaschia sp. W003]|uniref:squalene/phytoene synthase family protein n=1 Tax=Jannaschia sp. W003 TaxID=2867012 RepID=UPI0021A88C4B|nr:squalene/phytoene synthase family protein [Jannaschia sp. W003]UWQ22068.1 squalene/phytoene synthase family protein [Jannaschia sp. W003]
MSFAPATTERGDRAEVRRVVAGAGSSFALGMRVLPEPRRRAIHAVYALCRAVDDIADGDAPGAATPEARAAALDRWEREVALAFAGRPGTAIGAEIARAAAWLDLPEAEFALVIDGMRMDARAIVAPSAEVLDAYIRRVAGAAGILSMRCFGAWLGPPSERFALHLARGLQLVNILRDVEQDAAMGRLYLPRPVLEAAGLPGEPARVPGHAALPRARALVGADARRAFRAAAAEIPAHRRVPLLPALVMMGPYERLLRRWESDWTRPPPRRSRLGKLVDGLAAAARPV